MAKKGKLWSKLFTKKDDEEQHEPEADNGAENSVTAKGPEELPVTGKEVPRDPCHFCYEPFNRGEIGYKCSNCDVFYHYPDCVKNQPSCRSCGEQITLENNLVKFLKLRSVICPKCGMKVKLFFDSDPKLQIFCPSCGHEGQLPNPYLKELKPIKIGSEDDQDIDEGIEDEEELEDETRADEGEGEVWEEDEVDEGTDEGERTIDTEPSTLEDEGPKVIKPDKMKKRKAKLVTLDQSITCNECTKELKSGLPVVVCRCGKKYHEKCASNVGRCPTCDCSFEEIIRLIDEDTEPTIDMDIESKLETEQEPTLDIGTEIDTTLTFENLEFTGQNKIIKSIGEGIAKAPGLEFKVLYVHGTENELLTHFLQSIGNYIMYNDTELKIRYTTMEKFLAELNQAKELKKAELFEEFYSEAHVLLFDHLHDLPKKKGEKDLFLKIIKKLIQDGKQLVLSGNVPIDEIKNLDKKTQKELLGMTGLIINFSTP
jgi:DNA replication protein DnaC